MIYPQLKGEPNLLLIGIAAVFGLLLVIITFYIISTQNKIMIKHIIQEKI